MTLTLALVALTILIALIFDFINGFHDAANSIATVVSTRVLRPSTAVLWAAFFNLAAMFVFAPRVAETISKIVKINPSDPAYIVVILTGLIGASVWNILTWWKGLPTSSSHALIGGFIGAGIAHAGFDAIRWEKLANTVIFIFVAPLLGFMIALILMLSLSWMLKKFSPSSIDRFFRKGQLVSASLYSLGHGANDAQKTMGLIVALLFASGHLPQDVQLSLFNTRTLWIIISCQLAMGLGTALGGWRIVKTMGMRLTKLKPVGGFCAEAAGAATLFLATTGGVPVSTTQTITGSIIGVGSLTHKVSGVKWRVMAKIVWAWFFTIPASALMGALFLAWLK